MRASLAVLTAVFCGLLPFNGAAAAGFDYGASGYRYQILTGDFPAGVELPDFDDSSWDVGKAPFSNRVSCGLTGGAYWPADTKLVARLRFYLSGAPSNGVMAFAIDNDVDILLNGELVASARHELCAQKDDYRVFLPDGVLHAGWNVLVAKCVDRGTSTTFDATLSATVPPLPATCGEASEGEVITLTCPEGQVITAINFASYGMPIGGCGAYEIGSCHAATSETAMEDACLGQQSCSMSASNAVFGDPCGGVIKRLYAEVSCGGPVGIHRPATWGVLKLLYR